VLSRHCGSESSTIQFLGTGGRPLASRHASPYEENKGEDVPKMRTIQGSFGVSPDPRTRDQLSSWCSECHNEANRGYRRRQRVEALVAEAADFDREATAASGGRADSLRSTAAAVRRQAERELAG
jgi:hypothetical protein